MKKLTNEQIIKYIEVYEQFMNCGSPFAADFVAICLELIHLRAKATKHK